MELTGDIKKMIPCERLNNVAIVALYQVEEYRALLLIWSTGIQERQGLVCVRFGPNSESGHGVVFWTGSTDAIRPIDH